jgi:flagellar biosynthesis/type III secretory pathway protein FliH
MIERMIARDHLLLDTPYIRRWREEGFKEGREDGREEGRKEGLKKGSLITRRRTILEVLASRFELSIPLYQEIEDTLATISSEKKLKTLLTTAVQSEDLAAFQNVIDNL